ncbi:hypothetical protein [Emticicia sp. SJ17W-69]|uniref:hypothetical protein n=1 Tax=Emticicia sp. SJ17W-69 TaxID=3421657 RepID=UPI003EC02CBF
MNTIIKMKKHPIDDLFAKKLAEHRQEPSQKAFEKFQARLAEKQHKRRGGFLLTNRNWGYYAAAAGVVVALTIGVLSQSNTPDQTILASTNLPKQRDNKKIDVTKGIDNQSLAVQEVVKNSNETHLNQPEKAMLKVAKSLPIISNETSIAKTEIQAKDNNIVDDTPQEQTSVAINTIFETTAVEKLESKATESFKSTIDESIVFVLEPEEVEKEIIPAINEDSPTSLADAQRLGAEKEENAKSFIAKLYGEYKHFKYGEKVDLKKIGVKDVLARVDENLFKEDREDVIGFVQRKVGRLQKRD